MLELYQNRTVDLVAYGGTDSATERVLLNQDFALLGGMGEICTSAKKLSQRFIIKFFTDLGSKKYRPNYGTRFMPLLRSGQLNTTQDVVFAFNQAVSLIKAQFAEEERDTDLPADERLQSATLQSVQIDSMQNLILKILLKTQATEEFPIILPIKVSL